MSSVCRICLVGNTTLRSVRNKHIRSMYEKLTNAKLDSDDDRPRALCCFCYQKLLRCYTFSEMAVRSEKIFSHLHDKDLEVTQDTIPEVNLNNKYLLSVAIIPFINIDGNTTNAVSQVTIKEEPLPSTDLKEEVTSDPDTLLEAECFTEDSTKTRLTFEEYYSDRKKDTEELCSNTQTDQTKPDDSSLSISDEPPANIDIKEKEATTPCKLVEVESFPEQCVKSQFTFEEDYNDQEVNVEELLHKIHVEQTKPDDSKMPFICNSCNKIFYIKSNLISHIRNSHVEGKQFPAHEKHAETTLMFEDKTIHHRKKKLACHECDKTFDKKSILTRHIITHTHEKLSICHVCDKKFSQKCNLDRHMRIHTGEKPFQCHLCDKQFIRKVYLVSHIRKHTGEKPFTCHLCDKQFIQKHYLVSHMSTHTSEKPFACNLCDKKFIRKSYIVTHMRTHTGENSFTCHACDKQFTKKSYFYTHMRSHTGEKQFACHICDKQFNRKVNLVTHMRTHTGEKPFQCYLCHKQFNRKENLVTHMRTHTGEKPFQCYLCDKQFIQKVNLVTHMRTHTGEKPYTCHLCGKQFFHKHNLNSHTKTHTGEKPFECHICGKQFILQSYLILHMRTHTGEKPFACHLCDKKFTRKSSLFLHVRKHM